MRAVNFHPLNPTFFLPRAAAIDPAAIAVVHRNRAGNHLKYTYAQHSDRVQRLAAYFKKQNYKRIAILGPNTPAHLETLFAATAAGGIALGLNYRLSPEEIKYKMDLGKADLVVADAEFQHLLENGSGSVRDVLVDQDGLVSSGNSCGYSEAIAKTKAGGWDSLHVDDISEDSLLGLFFTSGTTGRPKAVEFTHRGTYLAAVANIVEAGLNCQGPLGGPRCHYLWTLPMFHAAGWTYPYAVTAVRGTHYCLRKIDVDYIWDLFLKERITHMNAAPTVNTMLLNSPKAQKIPDPVTVVVAASPPSPTLFSNMISHNLYPVHMYGLTETYGPFTRAYFEDKWQFLPQQEQYQMLARQGHGFLTSHNARVVRSKSMEDVAKNGTEIGEIVIRGNIVTKGYHDDAAETQKSFDGWFRSGDLAVMHDNGSIQVLDRKKDIIISGGENISSVAVETGILRYSPNILETSVVGVPDELYGEVPFAYITLKDKTKPFSTSELREWLRQNIGRYQVPKYYEVVDELPKTSTGKVRKNILRDMATSSVSSELRGADPASVLPNTAAGAAPIASASSTINLSNTTTS